VKIPKPIRAKPKHPSKENLSIIESCAIATLSGFDKSILFMLVSPSVVLCQVSSVRIQLDGAQGVMSVGSDSSLTVETLSMTV
jgi:hypothetical protein